MAAFCTWYVDLCSSDDEEVVPKSRTAPPLASQYQASPFQKKNSTEPSPMKRQRRESLAEQIGARLPEVAACGASVPSSSALQQSEAASQSFPFGGVPATSQVSPAAMIASFALTAQARQSVPASEVTHVSETVYEDTEKPSRRPTGEEVNSPQLSKEQEEILTLVRAGKSVFFTGNAGTGKSFLMNHIISFLKEQFQSDFASSVAVCASTGIAATHIGGTTLHSATGIGIPDTRDDFSRVWKKENREKWRLWRVLIIDEISMISGEMFECLEETACSVRGNTQQPFGGLQLVLCGDFFQLPPIEKKRYPSLPKNAFLNRGQAWQCPAWRRCKLEQRVLTQVFRQSEQQFVRILDAIRYNENAGWALQELVRHCSRPLQARAGVEPTNLFSRNADADALNRERLQALTTEELLLTANDTVEPKGQPDKAVYSYHEQALWRSDLFRECLAAKELKIKVGAQVMLLRNVDLAGGVSRMLVNGSRGVVIGFRAGEMVNGEFQPALELAQPQEGDKEVPKQPAANSQGKVKMPVVRFLNGREEFVTPMEFSADVSGHGKCKRMQVPLKLAWAITIHKCQGMSLDFCNVSLQRCFAPGQAYVALSRARSLEGLHIVDYSPNCVKTSVSVKAFHASLLRGEEFIDESWERLMRGATGGGGSGSASGSEPSQGQGTRPGQSQGKGPHGQMWGTGNARAPMNAAATASKGSTGQVQRQGTFGNCYKCGQPGHWARACPRS